MHKLEALLQREITRKQFLQLLGMAVLSIFGLSAIIGWLTEDSPKRVHNSYGANFYGR